MDHSSRSRDIGAPIRIQFSGRRTCTGRISTFLIPVLSLGEGAHFLCLPTQRRCSTEVDEGIRNYELSFTFRIMQIFNRIYPVWSGKCHGTGHELCIACLKCCLSLPVRTPGPALAPGKSSKSPFQQRQDRRAASPKCYDVVIFRCGACSERAQVILDAGGAKAGGGARFARHEGQTTATLPLRCLQMVFG